MTRRTLQLGLLAGSMQAFVGCATTSEPEPTRVQVPVSYSLPVAEDPMRVMLQRDVYMSSENETAAMAPKRPEGCTGGDVRHPMTETDLPRRRIVPTVPAGLRQDGHCIIGYDVTRAGQVVNVHAKTCTQSRLSLPARQSVARWVFDPLVIDGVAVPRCNLTTRTGYQVRRPTGIER